MLGEPSHVGVLRTILGLSARRGRPVPKWPNCGRSRTYPSRPEPSALVRRDPGGRPPRHDRLAWTGRGLGNEAVYGLTWLRKYIVRGDNCENRCAGNVRHLEIAKDREWIAIPWDA